MRSQLKTKALSMRLLEELINEGIIADDIDYQSLVSNVLLMKTILLYLGQGLSTTINESKFGLDLISDFELYFNCKSDTQLNVKIKDHNLSAEKYVELQKSRNSCVRFVSSTRMLVIDHFNLLGAPDRIAHKKKVVADKTRETAQQSLEINKEIIKKATEEGILEGIKKRKTSDEMLSDLDEEEDEEEDEGEESAIPSSSSRHHHTKTSSKFIQHNIKYYPTISTFGVFSYYDLETEKMYNATEKDTKEFFNNVFLKYNRN